MAAASLPDRDGAVREVAQVYELIKTHQPLLLVVDADEHSLSTTTLLAQNLLGEALRALNVALSFMNAAAAVPASIKAEPQVLSSSFPANSSGSPAADCKQASMVRRAGKRRRTDQERYSWINMTAVPHEDGYQWRKYGEKKIPGTHFTRSYFRCTYKDDKGCQARKQIQQKSNNETPIFQVTYNNEHTCNCSNRSAATSNNNLALLDYDCNTAAGINCPTNGPAADHASSRMIKQEPQAALITPLAAEVVVSDSDQTLWQEAFPASNNHCGVSPYDGIPSTACTGSCSNAFALSSCIDELDQMGQTTTTVMDHEPALGDDLPFYDPHLLLYDSFELY